MLQLKKGASLSLDFTYKNENGTPKDITGYFIQVKSQNSKNKSLLFDVSTDNALSITNALQGEFKLYIQDTSEFKLGTYNIDIEYIDQSGKVDISDTFSLLIYSDIDRWKL